MAHTITESEFPQSAPSPAPRSSTYTATTILAVAVYSGKIPDGVTAVTHGPFSRLTKHRVASESTADSADNVEGDSDIDPHDARGEEYQKFRTILDSMTRPIHPHGTPSRIRLDVPLAVSGTSISSTTSQIVLSGIGSARKDQRKTSVAEESFVGVNCPMKGNSEFRGNLL
ncbi:hypothetical protein FPQ18DRAFT_307743 [Pyronema domesticum]|nr:hypothetical protein FPQ18DRAFT_307743 [Pyronema domesticum]